VIILKKIHRLLDGHTKRLDAVEHKIQMRIGADEITKCEDCGCLLLKTKEFKRDSTIEKYVEKVVGFSNYGYAITKKVSPPPEDWDGDVT